MKDLWDVRYISVGIRRPPAAVYAFLSNPENIPQWAAGLARGVRRDGKEWVGDSPMGSIRVRFVEPNSLGVVDHDVVLPSGEIVHNSMRVLPNAEGSEVVFAIFRRAGVTESKFAEDAEAVSRDLKTLKELLERPG